MKPLKSALFFSAVLIAMQGIFLLIPREGVALFSLHLKNPMPAVQIRKWLREPAVTVAADTAVVHAVTLPDTSVRDTVAVKKVPRVTGKPETPLSFTDSLKAVVPRLEMNDTARISLFRVFRILDSLHSRKENMHILYYGDSQIEGDRITSVVRDTLQQRFGGGGPGLFLPVMTVPFTTTLRITTTGRWLAVTRKKSGNRIRFPRGIFGGYSVYDPHGDSTGTGHCRVAIQSFSPATAKHYNQVGVWLYPSGSKGVVRVHAGELPAGSDTVDRSRQPICYRYAVGQPRHKLDISFGFSDPVAVEAILIQDSVGVCVDNIPLRGRLLMPFTGCDRTLLERMFHDLNVRMIILQFGLNVAAGEKKDIKYYRKTFRRELRYLRTTFPEVFVVVVGVTDMAGDGKETEEKIHMIRDVQRQAALDEGYAFWDAFRAMGGDNAIMRWAAHRPSLARPDYAHLSYEGAQLLGTLFVRSLMKDYKEYQYGR